MKANEAPKKIYLQKYDTDTLSCLNRYNIHEEWTEMPVCANSATGNDIEYTRADAFMKKAENFLEMLGYGFTIIDDITHKNYDKEQLIDDFRKYMEGE